MKFMNQLMNDVVHGLWNNHENLIHYVRDIISTILPGFYKKIAWVIFQWYINKS